MKNEFFEQISNDFMNTWKLWLKTDQSKRVFSTTVNQEDWQNIYFKVSAGGFSLHCVYSDQTVTFFVYDGTEIEVYDVTDQQLEAVASYLREHFNEMQEKIDQWSVQHKHL